MIIRPYLEKLQHLGLLWTAQANKMPTSPIPVREGLALSLNAESQVLTIHGKTRKLKVAFESRRIICYENRQTVGVTILDDWNRDYLPMVGEDFLKRILSEVVLGLEDALKKSASKTEPDWALLFQDF